MLETFGCLNMKRELSWYVGKYNDVFKYFKLTGKFGVDDKIVDIKRGLVFAGGDSLFWDYLDSTHTPVKKEFGGKGLNCIKFILDNGKEVIIAEVKKPTQKLPKGISCVERYVQALDEFGDPYDPNSYRNKVYNILGEIRATEHEYFSSIDVQEKQRRAELIKLLHDKGD